MANEAELLGVSDFCLGAAEPPLKTAGCHLTTLSKSDFLADHDSHVQGLSARLSRCTSTSREQDANNNEKHRMTTVEAEQPVGLTRPDGEDVAVYADNVTPTAELDHSEALEFSRLPLERESSFLF